MRYTTKREGNDITVNTPSGKSVTLTAGARSIPLPHNAWDAIRRAGLDPRTARVYAQTGLVVPADVAAQLDAEEYKLDEMQQARAERGKLVAEAERAYDNLNDGSHDAGYGRWQRAEQALAEYDAAHPEVVAEVKAEQAEREAQRARDHEQSYLARGLD